MYLNSIVAINHMNVVSVPDLRKKIKYIDRQNLENLCLRLARYKIENKELITYFLFESKNEFEYVIGIKKIIDKYFDEIKTANYYYLKKYIRKILRRIKKFSKYSNNPETEVELILHFCVRMNDINLSFKKNKTLNNILKIQIKNIRKKITKLHCDLQFEYNVKIDNLNI